MQALRQQVSVACKGAMLVCLPPAGRDAIIGVALRVPPSIVYCVSFVDLSGSDLSLQHHAICIWMVTNNVLVGSLWASWHNDAHLKYHVLHPIIRFGL